MIRGRKRSLAKVPEFKINLNCSIHNRFDIEVIDGITGKVKQRAQAENVICNQLWTRLLTPSTYFNDIFFGTGAGTPAATDTALFTHLGYKAVSTPTYAGNNDEGWASLRQQCQISETEYIGSTLTEVGIGYGTASLNLVTHAMLKDMNGNQISITKSNTDIINIYATVFVHWDTDGYDGGSIRIVPPVFNTSMPLFVKYLLGLTGPLTLYPWFLQGGCQTQIYNVNSDLLGYVGTVTPTYSVADKKITYTATRIAAGDGNVAGGIGGVELFSYYYSYRRTLYPSISAKVGGGWFAGTAITGEAVATGDGSTVDFATDFDRVLSGAKIYIDGIEQTSGVAVDVGTPFAYTNMGKYFELISCDPNTEIYFPTPVTQIAYNIDSAKVGTYAIYYNPFYSLGIKAFTVSYATVYVSNDLTNWVDITAQASNVNETYRTYKYWKFVATTLYKSTGVTGMTADTLTSANNIHFTSAPASGAVITADYTTKTIAKDVNHVFDFSLTITLGEKTT
jgi:hypothetical protein